MSYKKRLNNIKAFIFDVDGVLTNGKVLITTTGEMYREMDTKDGYAIKCALEQGFKIAIISGGTNEGVRNRLKNLGIDSIYLGVHHKTKPYKDLIFNYNLKPEEVVYMGDDAPDIEVMTKVGIASCPQDAVSDVKKIADYISHKKGGEGCVRDIIEQVLRVQGKWLTTIGAKND